MKLEISLPRFDFIEFSHQMSSNHLEYLVTQAGNVTVQGRVFVSPPGQMGSRGKHRYWSLSWNGHLDSADDFLAQDSRVIRLALEAVPAEIGFAHFDATIGLSNAELGRRARDWPSIRRRVLSDRFGFSGYKSVVEKQDDHAEFASATERVGLFDWLDEIGRHRDRMIVQRVDNPDAARSVGGDIWIAFSSGERARVQRFVGEVFNRYTETLKEMREELSGNPHQVSV